MSYAKLNVGSEKLGLHNIYVYFSILVTCPYPPFMEHASILGITGFKVFDITTYVCDGGYSMDSEGTSYRSVISNTDGQWLTENFYCKC